MEKRGQNRGRPLSGLGLSDAQMRELQRVVLAVPPHLRSAFFARVAEQLRGQELGDGAVWRVARSVARELSWNAPRLIS